MEECLIGKHEWKGGTCIHCHLTKAEFQEIKDLEFIEHILNCNPHIEDKRAILRKLGFPAKKYEDHIIKLEHDKR